MALQLTIPTPNFGFDYDIDLSRWQQKLHAYRVFKTKPKELLKWGTGFRA